MKILDLYTDYLISQNKYATSTGLSSLLEVTPKNQTNIRETFLI